MSASPPQPTSTKRPLEEASSPSRATDQPDAKRPALDKVIKNDEEAEASESTIDVADKNGDEDGSKSDQPDVPVTDGGSDIKAADTSNATASSDNAANSAAAHDETSWIHIRAVISSPEAATIIGKGGENVSNIRKMSNAKCTVSDYQKGAVERILTVSGIVDAVAKAFGLIIRTLNNEPLGEASTASSKTYPLRLLIPHILIGSIIGKGGARIREIQEASGARLNASDSCLPMSSERSLVVMGVADAVHIATYYVGSTLLEQLNERFGGPAASAYATRSGAPAGSIPGGMQVVPYSPQPASGHYGRPENYGRHQDRRAHNMAPAAYPPHYPHNAAPPNPAMPMYGGQQAAYGGAPHAPQHMPPHVGPQPHGGPQGQPMQHGMPGGPLTQQIYIPNDMVGAIIGKGGQKINEIRQISGSVIKINEPQDNSNERLVTITGTEECNRMALYMLYSRLESEKHRV
ncbi:PCBP-like protein [Metarhizium album ARSEF 1941]|uniref:PCBP-like protein n=1 Tax=Metarhizium album (strain ARSEF 1941) TaxID=1081103 RepID=A0A0B2WPF6_METAS|nr:PCBP-like protein [Metarhizium album ARSEF 1941]KHN95352.1 PCBP-like protein [Metarhizium album ARSEF 1941]